MKRLLLLTVSLVCLAIAARAQEEETKDRINRIKRDTSYLYGEATMPTREEAMTLAKDFLRSYIEQWIAETRDTRQIRSVVARDLVADCEELSLMRGSMFRAFVYVRKGDLYAVDSHAVSIPISPHGSKTPARSDSGAEHAQTAAPALAQAAAARPGQAVAVAGAPDPGAAGSEDARADSAALAAAPAAATSASAAVGSVPESLACATDVAAGSATETASEPIPTADAAADRAFYDQLVRDLCGMQSKREVEQLLASEPYAAACTFGEVGFSTRPEDIEKGILVIYKPGNGAVAALLSPRSTLRMNLKTGRDDSTVNYPGCRALWICFGKE